MSVPSPLNVLDAYRAAMYMFSCFEEDMLFVCSDVKPCVWGSFSYVFPVGFCSCSFRRV